jgi:hypothetical protein
MHNHKSSLKTFSRGIKPTFPQGPSQQVSSREVLSSLGDYREELSLLECNAVTSVKANQRFGSAYRLHFRGEKTTP